MAFDYDLCQIAADYARYRGTHPAVLRELMAALGSGPAQRVLEIGCGTGSYIRALEEITSCSAWGIDSSWEMLAQASRRTSAVHWAVSSAEELNVTQESFGLAFSIDVVHHISDIRAYFMAAHRALVDGGLLCTVTDSEWIIRHRRPLSAYFPDTVQVDLARYPTIPALREEMMVAGFGDVREHQVEASFEVFDVGPYQDKAFSCLHLIPEAAFQRGMVQMRKDLERGPLLAVPRYLLLWGSK